MPISAPMRRLSNKWRTQAGWPKRLQWLDIRGVRGWTGQKFVLQFPIMAIVGENGVGKSTVLQCAASIYQAPSDEERPTYASRFFPDTAWETIRNATIGYEYTEGDQTRSDTIRKLDVRWRGYQNRPRRPVEFLDLSRILPVAARVGYSKFTDPKVKEISATEFDGPRLARLAEIMGREYQVARMALTDADAARTMLVLGHLGQPFSGLHSGAGETVMAELLGPSFPMYGLVLIDEIETSLHPRTQRRLMRDLASICLERQLQIIITTHSPYILDELPPEARAMILMGSDDGRRTIVYGVSKEFAMSKMDDIPQHECDLYVEDERTKALLIEIFAAHAESLVARCQIVPYGAASVGISLGQMVNQGRFPTPSRVFLDGDQAEAVGCVVLPGGDSPERVVMEGLRAANWRNLDKRVNRDFARLSDECVRAMQQGDAHEWVNTAATQLTLGGDYLWQAMCSEWALGCLSPEDAEKVVRVAREAIDGETWIEPTGRLVTRPVIPSRRGIGSPTTTKRDSRNPDLFSDLT